MADIVTESNLEQIIEATLFISGEGVEISSIAEKLEVSEKDVQKAVEKLKKKLSGESGIHIIQYRSKIQLSSNPNYANEVSAILNPIRERALTKATLETLSIIAYKQPITRLEIEEIRGVSCDYTVQVLMEHNLIEVIGRKDVVGKPLLFGTTDKFLKRFNLESLEALPNYEEVLERVKVIHGDEDKSDSLYFEYKIDANGEKSETENEVDTHETNLEKPIEDKDDFTFPEEEIPDFLKDEKVVSYTAESDGEKIVDTAEVESPELGLYDAPRDDVAEEKNE